MATPKRRVAITCQGGGSQTAFTAGALKALFDCGLQEHFELVSLSGTSGGAVCATLVWYALQTGDDYVPQRMLDFWADNTAQSQAEEGFNHYIVESLRAINRGQLPQVSLSPYSPLMQMVSALTHSNLRNHFTDFRALLERHIDFAALAREELRTARPALLLGAAEVLSGRLEKFCSRLGPIRVEHLLASCAVPNIFPAVEFEGGAYWDGLFSDNPPIDEVIKPAFVGADNLPQEIWVIKINPTGCGKLPMAPEEISDRRNEMVGNMSLFHQLTAICHLNDLLLRDAFRPEFLAGLGIREPVLVPKCFPDDPDKDYHIPFIEMSGALLCTLDYESKLDRSPLNIQRLLKDGEQQGEAFIQQRIAALKKGRGKQ